MKENEEESIKSKSSIMIENDIPSTDKLNLKSEEDLSRMLGCDCIMNSTFTLNDSQICYKCPSCPERMSRLCRYCIENCHRSHIGELNSKLLKNCLVNFNVNPCECALKDHKSYNPSYRDEEKNKAIINEDYCPLNKILGKIKPKFIYKRISDGKFYCMYCLMNFKDLSKNEKNNSVISTDNFFKHAIFKAMKKLTKFDYENTKLEEVFDDETFNAKYIKVPYDENRPIPACSCRD